jgi:tetratricopeptide (TPR) repeat protein
MFVDNIGAIRRMNHRDPRTIGTACLTYVMGGAAFAYSGTSFAISRRFLERAEDLIRPGEVSDELGCGFLRFVINFLQGRWRQEPGIASELLDDGLKHGILWDVNSYLGLESDRQLRQGRFDDARERLQALADMSEQYGYEFAQANHDGMRALLLLEQRQLEPALAAIEHYYAGRDEPALRVLALGTKAKVQSLLGQHDEAGATLDKAATIIRETSLIPPWHLSAYTVARLRHDLDGLRRSFNRRTTARDLHVQAKADARRALRIAKVVASARVETWRLVGRLHWLLGRPQKAMRWWSDAIREAEQLDALPELARTCAEIGERAPRGNGTGPARHLERAQTLFDDVGLSWDARQAAAAQAGDGAAVSRL